MGDFAAVDERVAQVVEAWHGATAAWVRRALWLGGFACLWLNVFDDPPLVTDAYLQNVSARRATIAKIVAAPAHAVCVVRDGSGAVVREVASAEPRRRHMLHVDGLLPATEYRYTLSVEGCAVEEGSLRTAPELDSLPVRFAFLGDSGDQPWWVWLQRTPLLHVPARLEWLPASRAVTAIGAAVAGYRPDFVLHLGDVVYPRGQHAHYRSGFFRPFAALLARAPVFPLLGNHDVLDAAGQQILANFEVPESALTGDGRCFSFAWGAVRIIGLDCNTDLRREHVRPGHPTLEFLAAELARCSEPWVVVASHFPMRSASRQRDRGDLLLELLPVLEQHQVSLYLSGHDHCYQRFEPATPDGVPLVVSGGGGKDLYAVRPAPRAVALRSAFHWCSAEVRGRRFEVAAHGLAGEELDRFELVLPAGERLRELRQHNPERAARIEALP